MAFSARLLLISIPGSSRKPYRVQITLFVQSVLYSLCKLAAACRVDRHEPFEEIVQKGFRFLITTAVFFFGWERFPYLLSVLVLAVVFAFKGKQPVTASDTLRSSRGIPTPSAAAEVSHGSLSDGKASTNFLRTWALFEISNNAHYPRSIIIRGKTNKASHYGVSQVSPLITIHLF